jgi:putative dimethyl sulfoxide reductase chaperone
MIVSDQSVNDLAGIARARAAFSSFLNIHFNVLPDEKFVRQMRKKDITSMLQLLEKDATVHEDITSGAALMGKFLMETHADKSSEVSEKLGVDRTRLYRGVSPTYGPPPPYEMVWSKSWIDVGLLQVLAAIYRENRLAPSTKIVDRLDYIGLELEFMHTMAMRETEARESAKQEKANALLLVQKQFFFEHLEPWIPSFVKKALEDARTDFYSGHLLMLRGFILDQGKYFSTISSTS